MRTLMNVQQAPGASTWMPDSSSILQTSTLSPATLAEVMLQSTRPGMARNIK